MTNREKYKRLLKQLGLTQAGSAELIAKITKRPCSGRTVRTWLADPELVSSRECPDWAVELLNAEYEKKAKKGGVK